MGDRIKLVEAGRNRTFLTVEGIGYKTDIEMTDEDLTTLAASAVQIIESRLRSKIFNNGARQSIIDKAKGFL